MVAFSAIDTERFGARIAREPQATAEGFPAALRTCREQRIAMLIVRCAGEDLRAAQAIEAAGGRLMDTLVYWRRDLEKPRPAPSPGVVRPLRPGDLDAVRGVSAASFRGYFGHYHADARLDRAKADEAYASWAERSCVDPAAATRVLVAEHDGRVVGFLTLLERGAEEQEIILNAVDPAFQRHGLYRELLLASMASARADGARWLSVSTQLVNIGVQKAWARAGFELASSHYTFHLWFDATGA
jgi:GNAT superfamily N-acetyltransferase